MRRSLLHPPTPVACLHDVQVVAAATLLRQLPMVQQLQAAARAATKSGARSRAACAASTAACLLPVVRLLNHHELRVRACCTQLRRHLSHHLLHKRRDILPRPDDVQAWRWQAAALSAARCRLLGVACWLRARRRQVDCLCRQPGRVRPRGNWEGGALQHRRNRVGREADVVAIAGAGGARQAQQHPTRGRPEARRQACCQLRRKERALHNSTA